MILKKYTSRDIVKASMVMNLLKGNSFNCLRLKVQKITATQPSSPLKPQTTYVAPFNSGHLLYHSSLLSYDSPSSMQRTNVSTSSAQIITIGA